MLELQFVKIVSSYEVPMSTLLEVQQGRGIQFSIFSK